MPRKPKLTALPELPEGQSALIARVDEGLVEVMEIGFVAGVRVTPTHSGVGGDPRVYELDGTLVAVRRAAARHIYVTSPEENPKEGD